MVQTSKKSSQANLSEEIGMNTSVLVLGGRWTGIKAASELVDLGYGVILADHGAKLGGNALVDHLVSSNGDKLSTLMDSVNAHEAIETLLSTRLVSLTGVPGDYRVRLQQDDKVFERPVGALIVALEAANVCLAGEYGLHQAENVLSQSDIEVVFAAAEEDKPWPGDGFKDIVFVVGLHNEESPAAMERTIRGALETQLFEGCQATVLVNNVKLAETGLEALYKQSREAGVLYFKLREGPQITQNGSNLRVHFFDPVLRHDVELTPDVLVVEEAFQPHPEATRVAHILGIDKDTEGFLQPDNVHFYPVRTTREGIYVIGSARQPCNLRHAWTDVENMVLEIRQLLGKGKKLVPTDKVKVHRGKCTLCLTCVRVCPHHAISWDNRAVISTVACQGCGICASECPMDAIQLIEYSDDEMEAQILASMDKETDGPRMIVFCCQNSAFEAAHMAEAFQMSTPDGLQTIKVPCAGKVDVDLILKAFQAGADGVMVLTCHKDNCKSQHGNTFAGWRVEDARRMLSEVGLEEDRLGFATIATNMPAEFVRITREMEDKLNQLGPSRIRRIRRQAAA
jgi:heterodisulfide reductase subunit A-like polyferredoxin/coenzyme F420-reducing hydrogenase delta subunit